ncbi:MAG: 7-carboxy-7-deazaguanine synthase [Candidatus Sericytochromatia bacterium]|nr:7-carboxy-7-deazaguanine synthase [Candidatus Sericytochromatia bacterium]
MSSSRQYSVKEVYATLQGEGGQVGQMAVFLRFSGCNLWSGREADRSGAWCDFCDTDFVGTDGPGGGTFELTALVDKVEEAWLALSATSGPRWVVCTGGEPTLQLDTSLVSALHAAGFLIAIETNGSRPVPEGVDWICVSPKGLVPLQQRSGQELKLVYPQAGVEPSAFEILAFERFYLQPKDGPDREDALRETLAYCMAHPRWRLSLQTHKLLGLR